VTGDWPAVRTAVLDRMTALNMTAESLARETGLSPTTVRYFGLSPSNAGTLTVLNVALGFPRGYLARLLAGEQPGTAGQPALAESPVMARLARLEVKLDELLTLARAGNPTVTYPEAGPS
jgi:hypothetical protein